MIKMRCILQHFEQSGVLRLYCHIVKIGHQVTINIIWVISVSGTIIRCAQ